MTEEQAVALMEELSNKLGALENYVLKHSPSVWLRWQRNRDEITTEWLRSWCYCYTCGRDRNCNCFWK